MSTQRSSFSKLQRDRDKQAKAVVKRERRQNRDTGVQNDEMAVGSPAASRAADESAAAEILLAVDQLHRDFEARTIDFEVYERRKSELLGRIKV
jgi:hypothetical protein